MRAVLASHDDDREPVRGFWRVTVNFGFMNTPDVPKALALTDAHGLHIPVFETSDLLSCETVVPMPGGVVEFFRLPGNAVVELGTRVQI